MNISDILNKDSPLYKQKEMSKSEYKKLVDRNTELIDTLKELEEKYNIMKENANILARRNDNAIDFINRYLKLDLDNFDTEGLLTKLKEILERSDKE